MPRPALMEHELSINDATARDLQVLVVDDSPVYRKLVEHALEGNPYSLMFAKSGREALDLVARNLPAIVITDWMMPDLSGLELCQRLRADVHRGYTYIILLTSIAEKDNVVKGLAAGADDYLTKPFDPGELLARIGVGRRIIDLHRQIDAKNKLLEEMAHSDPLTGLPNRRAIEDWAARQLRGAARHGFPYWVVLTDLDSFKSINDTHGHHVGDEAIRVLAQELQRAVRATDTCGRLGGDEFGVAMPEADERHASDVASRVRQSLDELNRAGKSPVPVQFSTGITSWRSGMDWQAMYQVADKALYVVKRRRHAGRSAVGQARA